LKKLSDANTLLLEEIASIMAASAPEREAAAEEIESRKVDVGGLRMDNTLLEYESSQLKAHLEAVMEENVRLSDNAFETGEFDVREEPEIDCMIFSSFDVENCSSSVSSCQAEA
jgi:hypothetical protein